MQFFVDLCFEILLFKKKKIVLETQEQFGNSFCLNFVCLEPLLCLKGKLRVHYRVQPRWLIIPLRFATMEGESFLKGKRIKSSF